MEERQKKRLGEILVENGFLSREHLTEALNYQKSHGGLLGQILVSLGYVTEEQVVSSLVAQLNIPYLPLSNYAINIEAAQRFEEPFCRRHHLVAFDQDDKHIFLAMADPLNESAITEIEKKIPLTPQIFISTTAEIASMIDLAFNTAKKEIKK